MARKTIPTTMSDEDYKIARAARNSLPAIQDALGAGQNRMTPKTNLSDSRFRKRYRQLSAGELLLNDEIKDVAAKLEALYLMLPESRYRSIALTELETSVMYGVKQLTGEPTELTDQEITRGIFKARRAKAD